MPSRHGPRLLLLIALALPLAGLGAVILRSIPETKPDQLVEIAPGVWFRHGDLKGHGHCNNGFVVFRDFVLVVDANFPDGAKRCLDDIRKVTDKPVRFVFDTHHHGDHVYGNPVWAASGALPVAHEKVLEELERYEPERWKEAAASREDIAELELDTAMPPVITYPDRMVFDDGTQRVELLHFGTAHTRGDGFAYLPKHRVLFTGDAVVNGPYNYMGDGDSHSWIGVIESLEELDVEIIAPGHGGPSDRGLFAKQKAFILALHEAVANGIAKGKMVDELRDEIELPEEVGLHVGDFLRDQVTKVYGEKMTRIRGR